MSLGDIAHASYNSASLNERQEEDIDFHLHVYHKLIGNLAS